MKQKTPKPVRRPRIRQRDNLLYEQLQYTGEIHAGTHFELTVFDKSGIKTHTSDDLAILNHMDLNKVNWLCVRGLSDVVETIIGEKAYFQNDKWYVTNVKIINKPKELNIDSSKLDIKYEKFLHTLDGFKPKILDNVYDNKSDFSIIDAITAVILLNEQGINTDKIRSILYNLVIVPFFVIPLLLLIFAYAALNSRFFNITKFTSFSIFGTLVIWGLFFVLYKFTNGGVLIPEISILLPMFLWIIISMYFYNRKINS